MRSLLALIPALLIAQEPRPLIPIPFENSAESGWLQKKVLASRLLDDFGDPRTWSIAGQAKSSFAAHVLRVEMQMFHDGSAPTRNNLAAVHLSRKFAGEDWGAFNRISFWIRPELSGFPMLPIEVVLHNEGKEKVPDVYGREGIHYVTLLDRKWQHVVWEIEPLARDKITSLDISYWVNKRLPDEGDGVAFEIRQLALERVEPDHYEGWSVAPGRISFSHTGYQSDASKTAIASDLKASEFRVVRPNGEVVLTKPVTSRQTRLGQFQEMDFSEVRQPGSYTIQAGGRTTRPFRIDDNVWTPTIWKVLNFFYGERCGFAVPGSHDVCHRDWLATLGDKKIVMNGGWHDAGDLSQGLVNTGEAAYAMFALAERLQATGEDPALLRRVIEEARWGLDWILKVRFEGGYRIGFAGMNIWTNGIIGDADDRTREALNNPNVNYIAAAAEAIAHRVLKPVAPALADRSLRTAEDDWRYAIAGHEGPDTWSTPAFAASPMELAGIGTLASVELYRETGKQQYADKAVELARIIVASQQKSYAGSAFPLAGFFYTGPDKQTLFHQFHRGNDQAPIVALAALCDAMPQHKEWMDWYSTVALYSEYQKTSARTTEPYGVLPAYVYRDDEYLQVPEKGDRYGATPEAYRQQVLAGMPMGDGYYLRALPVWFARRGNYGVLLSQAKGLAAAARLRRDAAAADLAQKQLAWVVGRNPFVQSTLYGEGYDWAQQYSVSSGDFVGALPVGMQSRGNRDAPYWPSQNCYVYKEVWVHSAGRWLWLMQDLAGPMPRAPGFNLTADTAADGAITIRAASQSKHTYALRASNLTVEPAAAGATVWHARVRSAGTPWVAVVVADGDIWQRRDVVGSGQPLARIIDQVRGSVNGDEALEFVKGQHETDRWFTFSKFQETAAYLERTMNRIGLRKVERESAPADGVTQFGFWTMPLAWDVKSARLEVVEPEARVLADYSKEPASLIMWSGATPPGGITADVVEWRPGVEVKGKMVLMEPPMDLSQRGALKAALYKAGAAGMISYATESPNQPDGHYWINAWGDHGWGFTKTSSPLVGFSITPRDGAYVRDLLRRGVTVRVKAVADTRYYPGRYPWVTAVVPGAGSDEEVLELGHAFETGAQDNSTGAAAMLEAAATLTRLIEAGELPCPKRSIRILVMPEDYGSMAYIAGHMDRMKRTIGAINMDTPAGPYDEVGAYNFAINPDVSRSYQDALILRVAESYYAAMPARVPRAVPYRATSDSYLSDPMIGVPTVAANSTSTAHHNSADTLDRVDPRSLRDLSAIVAAYLYYLASAGEAEVPWLADITLARGTSMSYDSLAKLDYNAARDRAALLSLRRLAPKADLSGALERLDRWTADQRSRLRSAPAASPPADPRRAEAAKMIVQRKRFGPVTLDDLPVDQREGFPGFAGKPAPLQLIEWCDGKRTVAEVIRLIELELGPMDFDFVGYFKMLARHGYVELK